MPGGTCGLFPSLEEHRKNNPITNADRIRAMSDEGLAGYFVEGFLMVSPDEMRADVEVIRGCYQAVLNWLKSPIETEGDENHDK